MDDVIGDIETLHAFDQLAAIARHYFVALVREGFDEEQALRLVMARLGEG